MNINYKLLVMYVVYMLVAASIVFLTPNKYHVWAVDFLVVAFFGLWRIRRAI